MTANVDVHEVVEAAREVLRAFDPTCGNGAMHAAIWGRALNFGVDGYQGGLRTALSRLDAAAKGTPLPDRIIRPRGWETFDAWRSSPHPVKAHPRERRCVSISPPWGPFGAGALCERPIQKVGGKWRHSPPRDQRGRFIGGK